MKTQAPILPNPELLTLQMNARSDVRLERRLAETIHPDLLLLASAKFTHGEFASLHSDPGKMRAEVEFALPAEIADHVATLAADKDSQGANSYGWLSTHLSDLSKGDAQRQGFDKITVRVSPNHEHGGYKASVILDWTPPASAQ